MQTIIDPRRAYTYFTNNFVLKKSTNGWWSFKCPYCSKPDKMAINFSTEYVKCWSCGMRGFILEFVQDYEDCNYHAAKDILWNVTPSALQLDLIDSGSFESKTTKFSSMELPKGFRTIFEGDDALAIRARRYLEKKRGFDLQELEQMGFGYCVEHDKEDYKMDFFGRIIIPFKSRGKLVYYIGRSFIGAEERYKNPSTETFGIGKAEILFNADALQIYDSIHILEGWADACTLGRRATATQGWALSRTQVDMYMKSRAKAFNFIPDAGTDDQGVSFYVHAVRTAMPFLDSGRTIRVLDPNKEHLVARGKDVNDIGKDIILTELKQTQPLDYEKAINILMK